LGVLASCGAWSRTGKYTLYCLYVYQVFNSWIQWMCSFNSGFNLCKWRLQCVGGLPCLYYATYTGIKKQELGFPNILR
jgi:hypothetical protein